MVAINRMQAKWIGCSVGYYDHFVNFNGFNATSFIGCAFVDHVRDLTLKEASASPNFFVLVEFNNHFISVSYQIYHPIYEKYLNPFHLNF